MTRLLLQYRASCRVLALLAVAFSAGCAESARPVLQEPAASRALDDDEKAELDAARSRWIALGLQDYEFDIRQGCFCPPEKQTWRHVQVMDGHIVSVIPEGTTSTTLQRITEPGWWTIDELFDEVLRRGDEPGGVYDLSVSYDTSFGYPASVRLLSSVPDGSNMLEVRGLTPLQ
jgi:hypothetical protein